MKRFRGHFAAVLANSVVLAAGACAEGDSLFSDASAEHSGLYERQLEESRHQLELEHTRGVAVEQQHRDLAAHNQELEQKIAAEEKKLQSLKAKVAKLDRETSKLHTTSAESASKKSDVTAQIAQVKSEIAALEQQMVGTHTAAELDRLKKRLAELDRTYSDLLAIYKSL